MGSETYLLDAQLLDTFFSRADDIVLGCRAWNKAARPFRVNDEFVAGLDLA